MSSISSDMYLYVIKLQYINLRYYTGNRVLVTLSTLLIYLTYSHTTNASNAAMDATLLKCKLVNVVYTFKHRICHTGHEYNAPMGGTPCHPLKYICEFLRCW